MLSVPKTVLRCSTKTSTFHGRLVSSGELDIPVPVPESFHEQTDEELTKNDIKRMDADDQAIQTILLGLPEDVYAVVDSCETAKEIWKCIQKMMKGSDIRGQEKKAKLSTDGESIDGHSLKATQGMLGPLMHLRVVKSRKM
uniref:Uncharacterized protein n=1 Tax=Tanacetum cinerariifolium TaxID=118510 RepID=A0A6L2N5G1_TANCI|nr:hypothetical protein [Tanacetum cinerariifolium]